MRSRTPPPALPALSALALGYFGLGTASLAPVGLGGPVGLSLHVPAVRIGYLVTVFALTFALAAPLAPVPLGRWDRRNVLLLGLALLTLGQVLAACAPDYALLAVARVVGALGAAVFSPAASATGAAVVPAERRQAALATVFSGMTAATVLGVPLVSYLGAGLGWRPALLGVGALDALALAAVARLVPSVPPAEPPSGAAYRRALRTPGVLPMVLTTLASMAAQFTTYAIAGTYLDVRFGADPALVSGTLLAFGVLGVLGNACAPRVVARIGAQHTVALAVGGVVAVFAALLVAPGRPAAGAALFAVWAFFSQLYQAPQQSRLVGLAPTQPALVLALNASGLYLGMSLGSTVGSALLPVVGARFTPACGLALAALAAVAHAASGRRPRSPGAAATPSAPPQTSPKTRGKSHVA